MGGFLSTLIFDPVLLLSFICSGTTKQFEVELAIGADRRAATWYSVGR